LQLIELGRGTWSDVLAELSCEYAGAAAHISSRAAVAAPSPSPLHRSLHRLRYDEARRELEISIGLDRGTRGLRCFVADPQRIFMTRSKQSRTLVVIDARGGRTLIQLAPAGETRDPGPPLQPGEDGAGPRRAAGAGG
jgi:hypothetical protein